MKSIKFDFVFSIFAKNATWLLDVSVLYYSNKNYTRPPCVRVETHSKVPGQFAYGPHIAEYVTSDKPSCPVLFALRWWCYRCLACSDLWRPSISDRCFLRNLMFPTAPMLSYIFVATNLLSRADRSNIEANVSNGKLHELQQSSNKNMQGCSFN